MRTLMLCLVTALAWGGAAVAGAADLDAGKAKAAEVCQACHGMDGNSPIADNPRLGGQYPDYLAAALRGYKTGARKNPVMGALAGTLSSKDIDNVAAYYASQPPVVATTH
jgi:cytochrome c553